MTPRIVHIAVANGSSSAVDQLALVASRLDGAEFEMHVCIVAPRGAAVDEWRALGDIGKRLTVIEGRSPRDPAAWWPLRKYFRRLRPAIVHAWDAAETLGRLAALAAGVPHVVASLRHGNALAGWHGQLIERPLAARSDAVLVNSHGLHDAARGQGLAPGKLRLIRDGVDATSAPSPSSDSRAALVAELGLPKGARLIGAMTRLTLASRIKDLIWAADLLKVIRDDVHLLIIGDGPQRTNLRRFRRQVRIADKVHFLALRADAQRILAHFEVFWSAAEEDGLSGSLLEAMAAGVGVVASDTPGHRELIAHGQNGFLVTLGDRAGFGRMADKLLDNAELARRLGEAGRARVTADFSIAAMVGAHAALYRELVAKR